MEEIFDKWRVGIALLHLPVSEFPNGSRAFAEERKNVACPSKVNDGTNDPMIRFIRQGPFGARL